ncbi:MAG: hypothetical protein HY902_04605 [Deltaproteobacteria bacterium]|nr:hypothetical protein [Deltaproteobacteria bacterium]
MKLPNMSNRQPLWTSLAPAIALLLAAGGCTDTAMEGAQDQGGIGLWFAALADGSCAATTNGTKQVPAGVETLVAQWTALVQENGGLVKKTGTAKASKAQAADSRWEIKNIPATDNLQIDIYGCGADKKLAFAGRSDGVQIQAGKKQTAHVFMAPVGDLGCAGSPVGAAKLVAPRSMAGWAVLPTGDVVVAGGMGSWDKDQAEGAGSNALDYYDQRAGHFKPAWNAHLGVARIQPHVMPLGADTGHVLVVGGWLKAKRLSGDAQLAMPLLGPPALKEALPATKAELVTVTDPPTSTASPIDPGVGTAVLSSAVSTGKSILFAGGQQQGGQIMDIATRLRDLEGVAKGGAGITESNIKLNVPRLKPALMTFPGDETVIVWGGMAPAGSTGGNVNMGELVLDTNQAQLLKLTGNAALIADANLNTIAPSATYLNRAAGVVTFLVAGGVQKSSLSADKALTYLVRVDKAAGTAELRPFNIAGGTAVRAGLFGMAVPLDGRRVLVGGGLMSVTGAVPGVCDTPGAGEDCPLGTAWVVRAPADLPTGEGAVDLEVLATHTLSVARFGLVGAPLPLGVLLAGGQKTTTGASDAATLSDVGAVLTVVPPDLDAAAICQ